MLQSVRVLVLQFGLKPDSFVYTYTVHYIQGVPGGKDLTSGECSLGQTIPI